MRLIMSIVLKKRLLAIGAALIFALSGSTVLAGSYHLGVFTKNKGYEAGREIKNQATNTIKVQVTGRIGLIWQLTFWNVFYKRMVVCIYEIKSEINTYCINYFNIEHIFFIRMQIKERIGGAICRNNCK